MNGSTDRQDGQALRERKARIILTGAGIGALLGLISSYLYVRAAEEQVEGDAVPGPSVSTGQLLAVVVATIGLVRQIAELGKPKKGDKGDKK